MRGGPGTNWENPRGPMGGPGAGPDGNPKQHQPPMQNQSFENQSYENQSYENQVSEQGQVQDQGQEFGNRREKFRKMADTNQDGFVDDFERQQAKEHKQKMKQQRQDQNQQPNQQPNWGGQNFPGEHGRPGREPGFNPPGMAGGPGAGPQWTDRKDQPGIRDNPPGAKGGPGTDFKPGNGGPRKQAPGPVTAQQ